MTMRDESIEAVLHLADEYATSGIGHASRTDRMHDQEIMEFVRSNGSSYRDDLRQALVALWNNASNSAVRSNT